LNTIYVSYHLGEATLSRSYSSSRLANDALGKNVKKCKRAIERLHKGGRSATGDESGAAQARGISDKLKHGGRSDAGRTENAREDDEKIDE
jgi:hypothetical protein